MADLLETKQDGVAILTMNRPEARNALSADMLAALLEALPRLAADSSVGAIIITGSGGAFCAGGDVNPAATVNADLSGYEALYDQGLVILQSDRADLAVEVAH